MTFNICSLLRTFNEGHEDAGASEVTGPPARAPPEWDADRPIPATL